ncbi:MAG TPA: hypothetical protein DEA08_28160, partial [Planctomycetes bacterium]|nr:hypothetical protein [Planctomycetota bacterium]
PEPEPEPAYEHEEEWDEAESEDEGWDDEGEWEDERASPLDPEQLKKFAPFVAGAAVLILIALFALGGEDERPLRKRARAKSAKSSEPGPQGGGEAASPTPQRADPFEEGL